MHSYDYVVTKLSSRQKIEPGEVIYFTNKKLLQFP